MKQPNYGTFKHAGIVTDIPPEEVGPQYWTGGSNVQFQEGQTIRVGGYEAYADPLPITITNPLFALNVIFAGKSYWLYCMATRVYVTDGETHWDISPSTPLVACGIGDWTGTVLNGIPVLNSPTNPPMYWDLLTTSKLKPLPGWPANALCKVIRSFKYHLFALNITDASGAQPNTLWWSESAAPGAIPQEWTPAPTNDAGDMTLADTPSGIVDGLGLRDSFIVYKNLSTYALSYVAGTYVYVQRKLFLTSGLQTSNCVTEISGEHWCFTGTDLIRHDGQNFTSVIQDKVKRVLVDSIEPGLVDAVCVNARLSNQQLWVSIPTQGNLWLNRALIVNILTGDCGWRDLPDVGYVARGQVTPPASALSWDGDQQEWDLDLTFWEQQSYSPTDDNLIMTGGTSQYLWSVDTDDQDNGYPVAASVERLSIPTNDNIQHALVTRVIPRLAGGTGDVINISVGGQDFFDQPINWSTPQPFTIGTSVAVDVQVEGRLISTRFEGTTARRWTLSSYKLAIVDLGLY